MTVQKLPRITVAGDIAYVTLTQEQITIISSSRVSEVEGTSWSALWHENTWQYLAQGWYEGKPVYLHRLLMGFPDGLVDHINGNSLDNRDENLRVVSNKENGENRKGVNRNSQTGVRGVTINDAGKGYVYYHGRVRHNGKLSQKFFPYTPEGLDDATQWVQEKRLELFTHSDGR